MGEVGGHQYRVSGWKSAGLAVAHAGVDQMGAFTCAATVAADGHVEGWRRGKSTGEWFADPCKNLRLTSSSLPKNHGL